MQHEDPMISAPSMSPRQYLADDVKIGDEMEVSHVSCKRARFL